MALYLDTSGLVKLVVAESHSTALRRYLRASTEPLVTSELGRTELMRAVRRVAPRRAPAARTVLESLTVLGMPPSVFEEAARLDPTTLRSLDALHLASALRLGDELAAVVVYDPRLGDAARALGLTVVAPS